MQKLQLQQKLQQRMTPQQIQQIKMLEYTALELEEKILQELEENPALEEGIDAPDSEQEYLENFEDDFSNEDFSLGDYINEDEIPSYKLAEKQNREDQTEQLFLGDRESFHEALINQLHLRELNELQTNIGEYIIGNIDIDGYLRRELSLIADDLLFQLDIDVSLFDLQTILEVIQDFEPAGVGALNLCECLLLQLRRKNQTHSIKLAQNILENHFDEFSRKHYDRIIHQLKISDLELRDAIAEITLLNPKPGNSVSDTGRAEVYQVIPDFFVETVEGQVSMMLNDKNIPDLHVSRQYAEMLQDYTGNQINRNSETKAAVQFVKQKLDSAKWFIDSLKMRQNSLTLTMDAIIEMQHSFFLSGDESDLRPMILKDLTDLTGLDISTLSRICNNKYVQTNYGIFPLKYFFSDGIQTDSGEEVSTREIKKILKEAVANEAKRRPLIDDKLCEILNEKGFPIARRTVAKYREALGIPVARLRKEI